MSKWSVKCAQCGRKFRYEDDFDKHRTITDKCADQLYLQARGLVRNKDGIWLTPIKCQAKASRP